MMAALESPQALPALELESLFKSFGNTDVVKNVSARIFKGEFVSLLGPSGCGKSTTLRMVAGFERPDRGRILVNGQDVTELPPNKRNLGMVFQSYGLFPHMTAAENVGYGLKRRGVPTSERRDRVAEALRLVRLPQMADRYPQQLSGGQQQRIALARALVIEPSLLLLDEPLSSLDAKLRVEMREEIRELQRKTNVTALFVTHDQDEALSVSDRIIVMSAGCIEQFDRPSVVYGQPATRFVADFMGEANLIEGVIAVEAGQTVLTHESGIRLPVASVGFTAGMRASASIRPEVIGLEDGASDGAGLGGVVEDVTYRGAFSMVHCRLAPSLSLRALRQNTGGEGDWLAKGRRVRLAWSPDAARPV